MAWAVAGWDEARYNRTRQKVYIMTNEQNQEAIDTAETTVEQEESDGTFGDTEAGPSEEEEIEEEKESGTDE
jgi:hypothetical protein